MIKIVEELAKKDGIKGLKIKTETGDLIYNSSWIAGVDYDEQDQESYFEDKVEDILMKLTQMKFITIMQMKFIPMKTIWTVHTTKKYIQSSSEMSRKMAMSKTIDIKNMLMKIMIETLNIMSEDLREQRNNLKG